MSYTEERTYPNLLGLLGKTESMVWAECLFGDPVADIAILSTPDRQELYDQAAAYDELTELRPSVRIDGAIAVSCWRVDAVPIAPDLAIERFVRTGCLLGIVWLEIAETFAAPCKSPGI